MSHPQMPAKADNQINMILLGTTGNGKSATMNSIMMTDRNNEITHGGWNSVTRRIQVEKTSFDGRGITVVDTPGIHASVDMNAMSATKKLIDEISHSEYFYDGFDAVLLVFSYGKRFSRDENETVKILNRLLAKEWLNTHGIIILTGHDSFRKDFGDSLTLMEWCQQQEGRVGNLFKECNYRCVLFDNTTNDKSVLKSQLGQLIHHIDQIRKNCNQCRLRLLNDENNKEVQTGNKTDSRSFWERLTSCFYPQDNNMTV